MPMQSGSFATPGRYRWVIAGLLFLANAINTAGIVGPALTGFIVQYGGGYGASFLLAGVLAVLGAVVVGVCVPGEDGGRPALHAPRPDNA